MQNTYWRNNKEGSDSLLEKYTSHFIWKVCVCERELETEQNCNILTPTLMAITVVCFSFSWCSTGGPGAQLSAGFLYHIFSPTQLTWSPTNWLPVFTELYNSSIAHSVSILMASQAGICHFRRLWTGMFDHHQAEITVMQFRGTSVYECTMGFYLVPFCQPSPPTLFLLITAIEMCHFLPLHHFGMTCLAGSKVNIQHKAVLTF